MSLVDGSDSGGRGCLNCHPPWVCGQPDRSRSLAHSLPRFCLSTVIPARQSSCPRPPPHLALPSRQVLLPSTSNIKHKLPAEVHLNLAPHLLLYLHQNPPFLLPSRRCHRGRGLPVQANPSSHVLVLSIRLSGPRGRSLLDSSLPHGPLSTALGAPPSRSQTTCGHNPGAAPSPPALASLAVKWRE